MKKTITLFLFVCTLSCAQHKTPITGETEWQKEMNANFKDANKSPLRAEDLKTFKSLDFFPFNSTYVVKANLKVTSNTKPFDMKTSTKRLSRQRVYGVVTFELKGKTFKLNVYQSEEYMNSESRQDYLFLPFLDDTNGLSTFGGGRYIDLTIPEGDTIEIDFNKAYNPYCTYNENYSCPIAPSENYLETAVEAGVKAFDQ